MNIKRILTVLLAVTICLSIFAGCGEKVLDEYPIDEKIVGFWQAKYIVEDGVDVDYFDYGIGFEATDDGSMYNYNYYERFNDEPFEFVSIDDMQIYLYEDVQEYAVDFYFERIDDVRYLVWEDATITMKFVEVDKDEFLSKAENYTGEEQATETTADANTTTQENANLGPLDGFADNKSFEIFTNSKTFQVFKDIKVEGTFEEGIQALVDAGMIEKEAPYDNYVGGLKVDYSAAGEEEKYWITLNKNSDGVYDSASYYINAYECEDDLTGFHASEEVYDEMLELIHNETVTTQAQMENYFGKAFIQSKMINSDGTIMYYYAWRNKSHQIYSMVDEDMNLTSYKIGCTALPDVYTEDNVNTTASTDTSSTSTADTNETASADTTISGTKIETDYFTITKADGWSKMEITDGMQFYKGSEVFQIGLEGSGMDDSDVKTYIENAISNYNGSELTNVDMWGYSFYATVYDYSGTTQMLLAAPYGNDGQQLVVKIAYVGEDIPADILNMSDSVIMK